MGVAKATIASFLLRSCSFKEWVDSGGRLVVLVIELDGTYGIDEERDLGRSGCILCWSPK